MAFYFALFNVSNVNLQEAARRQRQREKDRTLLKTTNPANPHENYVKVRSRSADHRQFYRTSAARSSPISTPKIYVNRHRFADDTQSIDSFDSGNGNASFGKLEPPPNPVTDRVNNNRLPSKGTAQRFSVDNQSLCGSIDSGSHDINDNTTQHQVKRRDSQSSTGKKVTFNKTNLHSPSKSPNFRDKRPVGGLMPILESRVAKMGLSSSANAHMTKAKDSFLAFRRPQKDQMGEVKGTAPIGQVFSQSGNVGTVQHYARPPHVHDQLPHNHLAAPVSPSAKNSPRKLRSNAQNAQKQRGNEKSHHAKGHRVVDILHLDQVPDETPSALSKLRTVIRKLILENRQRRLLAALVADSPKNRNNHHHQRLLKTKPCFQPGIKDISKNSLSDTLKAVLEPEHIQTVVENAENHVREQAKNAKSSNNTARYRFVLRRRSTTDRYCNSKFAIFSPRKEIYEPVMRKKRKSNVKKCPVSESCGGKSKHIFCWANPAFTASAHDLPEKHFSAPGSPNLSSRDDSLLLESTSTTCSTKPLITQHSSLCHKNTSDFVVRSVRTKFLFDK